MSRGVALLIALAAPAAALAVPTIATLHDHRRVLIVAAPTPGDARLAEERRALARWRHGAHDRDLTFVTVIGDNVTGVGDRGKILRRSWHLPPEAFQVILVGKDGHEALRSHEPLSARTLEHTIDAMPMRRAGQR